MFKEIAVQLRLSFMFVVIFTIITGFLYPGVVTLLGKAFFSQPAEGSLLQVKGKTVGSELIGQAFDAPQYFWGRPSATAPQAYNASSSSGSNLGPTNPDLLKAVQSRVAALRKADPDNKAAVPMDLVTTSGSGLDPHISLDAAHYQSSRVAKARHVDEKVVQDLIGKYTQPSWLGFVGDPVVNVLKLNLALDELK